MSTLTISAGAGDCYCNKPSVGTFDSTGQHLYLGGEGSSGDDVTTWIPFIVPVANGKIITSATLRLTASENGVNAFSVDVRIGCEAADTPANPTSVTDLRARVMSAANIALDLGAWTLGVAYTYDVTAALQEIINRPGWPSGGVIAVLITDEVSANARYRRAASLENVTYTEPQLVLTYPSFVPRGGGAV